MTTDWELVRSVLNAAIDACEAAERLQLPESDRCRVIDESGVKVSDVWISAWTYPETLRMQVIRARHLLGEDLPHVPNSARVLRAVGELGAELIGAGRLDDPIPAARDDGSAATLRGLVGGLVQWYDKVMTPFLASIAASDDSESSGR